MWFSLPIDYDCVVRNNDTTLYAYKNNIRDSFIPNGFSWQKTSSQINSNIPSNAVCLSDNFAMPSSVLPSLILSGVIVVLCVFKIILNMFMGVRR